MHDKKIVSFCGDVCSECPRFIATAANDTHRLEEIAALWFRLGLRDKILAPEEMKCTRCRKDKYCSHHINDCEQLENKNNCGECDFFPCDKIKQVFQKTALTDEICKNRCSAGEYKSLRRAFLMKKQILVEINTKYKGGR